MNKSLLRRIAKSIEEKPRRYKQSWWMKRRRLDVHEIDEVRDIRKNRFECGAVGCVAGHAVVMSRIKLEPFLNDYGNVSWLDAGAAALGLDVGLAYWLFDGSRKQKAMPTILRAIAAGETELWKLEEIERQAARRVRSGR